MAACSGSQLTVDWFGLETDVVNMSDWTNGHEKWGSIWKYQKRSDIVHAIVHNHRRDHLMTILGSGWDVNETLKIPQHLEDRLRSRNTLYKCYRQRTALGEAARRGWTEGVKMLLDAGAECRTHDICENPLMLALKNADCPPDLIELLLKLIVSDWTDGHDTESHQKRSDIIHLTIKSHKIRPNQDHLRTILRSGWDVNEILNIGLPGEFTSYQSTALHEAAKNGCTEGVKMLLDAGARCKISGILKNPLTLALQNRDCPTDLIELLLKHGADPNDHEYIFQNFPILCAIKNCQFKQDATKSVKLLLDHGADPNVDYDNNHSLSVALNREFKVFSTLFKILVHFGADVNYTVGQTRPLIYEMMHGYAYYGDLLFLQDHLDLVFLYGGNINIEWDDIGTALECALRYGGHINSYRWLIRHGADTSFIKFTLLKKHLNRGCIASCSAKLPVLLLQAGMRVSHGAQTQLSNMETAISTWLQEDTIGWGDMRQLLKPMWAEIEKSEIKEIQRKANFPEYCTKQMVDLQEFSDESLHAYPEDNCVIEYMGTKEWRKQLDMIHLVLEFLSQPQSLQWYCCRCVRESLVSLQPSIVKTLHLPAKLKRYILCHEI